MIVRLFTSPLVLIIATGIALWYKKNAQTAQVPSRPVGIFLNGQKLNIDENKLKDLDFAIDLSCN